MANIPNIQMQVDRGVVRINGVTDVQVDCGRVSTHIRADKHNSIVHDHHRVSIGFLTGSHDAVVTLTRSGARQLAYEILAKTEKEI